MPFTIADTGADFIGFSLHKWVAAPLGVGAIYIRKERLGDIAPFLGNKIREPSDIRARILTGTINYAAHLTIPTAIDLHRRIGSDRKLAHLLDLRNFWYERVRDLPGIEFQLADEPGLYAAITSFRPKGLTRWEDFQALQKRFLDRHRVLIVAQRGLAAGPVMRVTPSLFNTSAELDRLVAAIRKELHDWVL